MYVVIAMFFYFPSYHEKGMPYINEGKFFIRNGASELIASAGILAIIKEVEIGKFAPREGKYR